MNLASLADMTRKLAFLLTLASARGNSKVWAFSADVRFGLELPVKHRPSGLFFRFRQAVVSTKIARLKRQIRVNQHPNISSGLCCVPLRRHTDFISQQTVRVDQTLDHTRLTRRVRMRFFLTQPTPTSKQESSEHLPLPWRSSQLSPEWVLNRVSWRNNNVCFFCLRDEGCDDGPLVAGQQVIS